MSAIAGVLRLDDRPVDRLLLEALTTAAPGGVVDAVGYWQDGPAALGHALWHVTPESIHEQPPLRDQASGCLIVFDGRLDNRPQLASALAGCGCLLDQDSDAAYALSAYLHWGEGAPERLLGDFAFAIWDPRARRLLLARDPLGMRPLFYSLHNHRLAFASTLEQLLADPELPRELNEPALVGYLYGGSSLPPEQTCYRFVSHVPGGHRLTVSGRQAQLTRYWHWPEQPPEPRPATGSDAEEFRGLLAEAVRCRIRSITPVGLLLSGGLDSSSIACLAGHLHEREGTPRVQAYSLVFDEFSECDERAYSTAAASRVGLKHTLLPADDCSALSHLEQWLPIFSEPFFGPYDGTQLKLFAQARADGMRVLLMGHGGDHLLSGSAHYLADWVLQRRWRELHKQVRARAVTAKRSYLRSFISSALLPLVPTWTQRIAAYRPDPCALAWMPAHLRKQHDLYGPLAIAAGRSAWWYQLRRQLSRFGQYSHEAYMDRLARLMGVQVWQPLLDVRLIRFVLRTPPDAFYRNGTTKVLLRESLRDILPPQIRDRPDKPGLGLLIDVGLRQRRRAFVEALLVDSELERRRYVLPRRWKSTVQTFLQGDDQPFWYCWRSLTLEMWLRVQEGRLPPLA